MQSFCGSLIRRQSSRIAHFKSTGASLAINSSNIHGLNSLRSDSSILDGIIASKNHFFRSFHQLASRSCEIIGSGTETLTLFNGNGANSKLNLSLWMAMGSPLLCRSMTTAGNSVESTSKILDKEAVQEVSTQREIPDIKPGYIVQLKVEVPENKRRISIVKGIVITRPNAGLNTTFRLRRLVAGVGVESLFPL
ncbi:hypothetical protein P3X46_023440 [Hevea brasiliensis]|uniref:Ribosomal protein L19 n=1 Tax=Hevea brasiliensis TaxID=3981 RepID=A0ABQ9LEF1_HEVBR|nr:hypothetical protein P3X46_023440 [Hevea brasiliensis]